MSEEERDPPQAAAADDADHADDADDAALPMVTSTLDILWKNTLDHWNDDKAHAAFLEFAAAKGELPEAAGRYREIKDAGGERSEMAAKKLSAIVTIAMQMLASERTDPGKKPPTWLTVIVMMVSFAIVGWVASIILRH